ncbi:MAG: lasso peptide biosynthesis B2 protein [Sulfurovum sp.]|uniref:lasso peptide biosynthesis B2 protein n=1 Tax=Sulfurovum sp. TaxID=1969726 RepID=UPI002867D068|nr:lasso peptide biosynthesis B2 protein [Sulfurovum sp.]MCO4846161.1 lasso peptide biosynthesis B2 protein [Sulfurovum sp.]
MLHKFKKFSKLSSEEKKLFLEAYITLGMMRTAILTISFKRLTRDLEHLPQKENITALNDKEMSLAIKVGQAITRAAAYTPWESACLAQSLTAQKMLQKRGIPGVFYLGAAKDEESKEKMKAHAWSQCGDTIITGAKGHEAFTVLSVFGWTSKQTV